MMDVADLIITIAYFSIPFQIVWSLTRHPALTRKVASNSVILLLVLFALFIFCCGLGHLIRCLGLSDTHLFQVVNVVTAIVSMVTALYLIPIMPTLFRTVDANLRKLHRSKKIVKSMYPESFRERIMMQPETNSEDFSLEIQAGSTEEDATLVATDHSDGGALAATPPSPLSSAHFQGPPIADLVLSSHVMFADITGFTAWSTRHTPVQVFCLLETLFWEFDRLAQRFGVFKLGTIGDCYIAATGLPMDSQVKSSSTDDDDDDVVVMAQFTEECRRKMNELFNNDASFGFDTSQLSMRFGLHSGDVVAGILRGKKSRFELFGDTMNTASRMESLGEPNRIHVSQATADALVRAGREEWLEPRTDKIIAKGKGEMATYWLDHVILSGDCSVKDKNSQEVAVTVSDIERPMTTA